MDCYMTMLPEIKDAIEFMYEKDSAYKGVGIDCYLYLAHCKDPIIAGYFSRVLELLNRCEKCGAELEFHSYKEYHPEVDDGAYEEMKDWVCPNCGV